MAEHAQVPFMGGRVLKSSPKTGVTDSKQKTPSKLHFIHKATDRRYSVKLNMAPFGAQVNEQEHNSQFSTVSVVPAVPVSGSQPSNGLLGVMLDKTYNSTNTDRSSKNTMTVTCNIFALVVSYCEDSPVCFHAFQYLF